jgi:hypothetical protein
MIFDWNDYVSEQIRWAECLLDKAGDMQGVDADALYLIAQSRLEDVRRIQENGLVEEGV